MGFGSCRGICRPADHNNHPSLCRSGMIATSAYSATAALARWCVATRTRNALERRAQVGTSWASSDGPFYQRCTVQVVIVQQPTTAASQSKVASHNGHPRRCPSAPVMTMSAITNKVLIGEEEVQSRARRGRQCGNRISSSTDEGWSRIVRYWAARKFSCWVSGLIGATSMPTFSI